MKEKLLPHMGRLSFPLPAKKTQPSIYLFFSFLYHHTHTRTFT